MKMKSCLTVLFAMLFISSYGQINLLNADHPEEIGVKTDRQEKLGNTGEPLPYGYVSDRQVMWGKQVWEYIDLSQKFNFPLLYPIDTGRIGNDRKSLYYVLVDNIKNGNIKHIYADSYFQREVSLQELQATLHMKDTLDAGYAQMNAGEEIDRQFITTTDVSGADVQGYRIRGYWYFDKRQGDLRYRLIGICPMVTDAYSKSMGVENSQPVELFWVFYPAVRTVLYHAQVYNRSNSAHPLNYDEILNARRFHATIYKASNVQGDRAITQYIGPSSLKQLLESRRIKNEIRAFEANMWNY